MNTTDYINDYAARQAQKDRTYAAAYDSPEAREWIASLSLEERQRLEADGLLRPMLDRTGSTRREQDAAAMAIEECDIAEQIDAQEKPSDQETAAFAAAPAASPATSPAAADVLASFCARMRSCTKPALAFDAVCYATGVLAIEGQSATALAAQHGVTRQAFSKIVVEWSETFGLPPARAMKSKQARETYRQRAKAVHARNKLARLPKI